jgi:hypothetical protein
MKKQIIITLILLIAFTGICQAKQTTVELNGKPKAYIHYHGKEATKYVLDKVIWKNNSIKDVKYKPIKTFTLKDNQYGKTYLGKEFIATKIVIIDTEKINKSRTTKRLKSYNYNKDKGFYE